VLLLGLINVKVGTRNIDVVVGGGVLFLVVFVEK
jgi:hypothetical protein